MTNCDNCPWNLKREACRAVSIERISAIVHEYGAESAPDLRKYRNQTLRTLAKALTLSKEQMEAEEFRPDLQEFKELVDVVLRPITRSIRSEGRIESERRVAKVHGKEIPLPVLYLLGVYHGLEKS